MTTAVATSPTAHGRRSEAAPAVVEQRSAAATGRTTTAPLSSLRRGATARIASVSDERGPQIAQRLIDLGLEPGRVIEVGRRAPMGDPTVYRVADYSVSLRRRDAALVVVEADGAASASARRRLFRA